MFTFVNVASISAESSRREKRRLRSIVGQNEVTLALFGLFQKQCERGRPGRGTPSEERAAREHRPNSEAVSRR